jgi:hypothetical protein
MRKMVSLGVSSSWFMCEAEVKMAEIEGPLGLTTSEVLSCVPVLKVPMVGDDVKGKGKAACGIAGDIDFEASWSVRVSHC